MTAPTRTRNAVRYQMNSFLISVGCYMSSLTESATESGHRVADLSVDMGNTDCNVPFSPEYIRMVRQRGRIGKKRKSMMC